MVTALYQVLVGKPFYKTLPQSWPFKVRDRTRAPPHAPCFDEVHNKHAPSKIFTLLRAPGNRTERKEELFCFLFLNNLIK